MRKEKQKYIVRARYIIEETFEVTASSDLEAISAAYSTGNLNPDVIVSKLTDTPYVWYGTVDRRLWDIEKVKIKKL